MDHNAEIKSYSKVYRWLGLLIDMCAASEDEDDNKLANIMRKDPTEVLETLVQIRMTLITFKMANVSHEKDGSHLVIRKDFEWMLKTYPPDPSDKWWPVWIRYIRQMDDVEWANMWLALDLTIEEILTSGSGVAKQTPSLYN